MKHRDKEVTVKTAIENGIPAGAPLPGDSHYTSRDWRTHAAVAGL